MTTEREVVDKPKVFDYYRLGYLDAQDGRYPRCWWKRGISQSKNPWHLAYRDADAMDYHDGYHAGRADRTRGENVYAPFSAR